jgi:anaerobic selenocysteine-containing dehydrogenase
LLQQLIAHDWIDQVYIGEHTRGFEALASIVAHYPPRRFAEICGVEARDVEAAAEIFGTSSAAVSTVLQGFYQSHQATAASVAVNNMHLLRGMLGRRGAGILQMNGQPTAQNNRETGADGDLPGFRNWQNEHHVAALAELWNVDPIVIPDWAEPTHAMQIFRYVEQGSLNFLWIAGTNPAVSLPELSRIRKILGKEALFLVVSDGYLTETTAFADVVLPAALWGEKTGTYTNTDRTVHLSERAVAPPGEARSDLDIWLDYARRMGFTDRSGRPLPPWETSEGAFNAWRECSRGRACDYSGLSYDKLRDGPGIQWPCNDAAPNGTDRLYVDHHFITDDDQCETYGHDLATGGDVSPNDHAALRFDGRARLKGAEWTPPPEGPDDSYPMQLMTGRTVYHFHTRTKTGRAPELNAAAPEPWVELAPSDAAELDIQDGDLVRVESRRGAVEATARCTGNRPGTLSYPSTTAAKVPRPTTSRRPAGIRSPNNLASSPGLHAWCWHLSHRSARLHQPCHLRTPVRRAIDHASVLLPGSAGDGLRNVGTLLPPGCRGSPGGGGLSSDLPAICSAVRSPRGTVEAIHCQVRVASVGRARTASRRWIVQHAQRRTGAASRSPRSVPAGQLSGHGLDLGWAGSQRGSRSKAHSHGGALRRRDGVPTEVADDTVESGRSAGASGR